MHYNKLAVSLVCCEAAGDCGGGRAGGDGDGCTVNSDSDSEPNLGDWSYSVELLLFYLYSLNDLFISIRHSHSFLTKFSSDNWGKFFASFCSELLQFGHLNKYLCYLPPIR